MSSAKRLLVASAAVIGISILLLVSMEPETAEPLQARQSSVHARDAAPDSDAAAQHGHVSATTIIDSSDQPATTSPNGGAETRAESTPASIATILGRVVDQKGIGVAGAEVVAASWEELARDTDASQSRALTTRTETDGRFEFQGLPSGPYRLRAAADGCVAHKGVLILHNSTRIELTMQLSPVGTISGLVTDRDGNAIDGAMLQAHAQTNNQFGISVVFEPVFAATTDAAGQFSFLDLYEGRWSIDVQASGFAETQVERAAGNGTPLHITLTRFSSVSGVVQRQEDGQGAAVRLWLRETAGCGGTCEATCDAGGHFECDRLTPGTWSFRVENDRYVLVEQPSPVTVDDADRISGVRLLVATGGVISGRVYDIETGAGVEDAMIQAELHDRAAWPHSRRVASDRDGYFRIEGIPAGTCSVFRGETPRNATGTRSDAVCLRVALGAEADGLDFPVSRGVCLRGQVQTEDGNPLKNAELSAWEIGTETYRLAESDVDGLFEFQGFARGDRLRIRTQSPGWVCANLDPIDLDAVSEEGIVVTVIPQSELRGFVVDAVGDPVRNAQITCTDSLGAVRHAWSSHSAVGDGNFSLGGLAPGTYSLFAVSASGGASAPMPEAAIVSVVLSKGESSEPVTLVSGRSPGFVIAGRVTDPEGRAVVDAEVVLHAGIDRWRGFSLWDRTDEHGAFSIFGVAEGEHDLSVYSGDYAVARRPRVAAGEQSLAIVLWAGGRVEGVLTDGVTGRPIRRFEVSHAPGVAGNEAPLFAAQRVHGFDAEGRFELRRVPPGDTSILLRAAGYRDRIVNGVQVPEGGVAEVLRVALTPAP